MTDLYSATSVLIFTPHTVISGPYHRNERGILDVLDFFGADKDVARALADKYKLDYVSYCMNSAAKMKNAYPDAQMGIDIANSELPEWLEEISPEGAVIKVLRVLR